MSHRSYIAVAFALWVAGCSSVPTVPATPVLESPATDPSAAHKKIQHVIILVQENRSFDNFFARFPGADGATQGRMSNGQTVTLAKHPLLYPYDMEHTYHAYRQAYDATKMDGFDLERNLEKGGSVGSYPYSYVDPKQIAPYWTMAKRYALLDHFFQTQGSASFTAHQDLIAGGTPVTPTQQVIDDPSNAPWGCVWSPPGTITSLITLQNNYETNKGPYPCYAYSTIRDLLDRRHINWKYYTPYVTANGGAIWNAFAAIRAVHDGPQWSTNISRPQGTVLTDIAKGNLPSVAWVIPGASDSDHPGEGVDRGPSWTAAIVNAIGKSPYWDTSAIVVVWDDSGGLYDHVPPPQLGYGGLGFRLPALVISPYVRAGTISHEQFEFGSILRFVENVWELGSLHQTDARANSIGDVLNYNQTPRRFVSIPAPVRPSFFLHEPPDDHPPDSE